MEMDDYQRRLAGALESRGESLDMTDLKKLRDHFKLFQTAFASVYSVLMKKGLVHDDPYRFDMKISEVDVPSEKPFSEADRIDQMCVRLSQFDGYLEFLNNYYQFSTNFLSLNRIKRLTALVKYFSFTSFSENSQSPNTRALAELVGNIRKGSDQLSTGILNESLFALERATKDIMGILKQLTLFHREMYKLKARQLVFSGIALEHDFVYTHREDVMRQVKRRFSETSRDQPFYPELIEEILDEDYLDEAGTKREAVINGVSVKQEKSKGAAQAASFKTTLLDGIRLLSGTSFQLEDAIVKLKENSVILEERHKTFFSKLRMAFRKLVNPHADDLVYELEYLDPVTSERSSEDINFTNFCDEILRRAKLYASMSSRNSPQFKRVESAPDEQAFKILEKTLDEVQKTFRRLTALDEYFKAMSTAEDRARLHGIKVELNIVKSSIIKANQKKHEYVAQIEEIEQMKRLGIRADGQ